MDFLVRMDTTAVHQLPDQERKELIERESVRGRELRAAGILRNIWRLPGQKANVGIWSHRSAYGSIAEPADLTADYARGSSSGDSSTLSRPVHLWPNTPESPSIMWRAEGPHSGSSGGVV
jgi:hypothetical protein